MRIKITLTTRERREIRAERLRRAASSCMAAKVAK